MWKCFEAAVRTILILAIGILAVGALILSGRSSEASGWRFDSFDARDTVEDSESLNRSALAQLGFPIEFTVESVEPAFCPDFDGDGKVTVKDIMEVAAVWGPCPAGP